MGRDRAASREPGHVGLMVAARRAGEERAINSGDSKQTKAERLSQ